MATVAKGRQEERPRNGQTRNEAVPEINVDYITQMSEEIEGRVTKKLFQEFSGTESQLLGALSNLKGFFPNPQVRAQSGTVLGTSWNSNTENHNPNAFPERSSS